MQTILWIHGFPLSSRVFDRQRAIGAEHLMPDLPGFGDAPPPGSAMTMESYARHVLPEREVILAGLSMGGYIAFAAARLAPERVKGLILIDTRETPDDDEQRKARYDTIEKVKREGIAPVVASMLPKMLTSSAPPELVDEVRRIMESSSAQGVTPPSTPWPPAPPRPTSSRHSTSRLSSSSVKRIRSPRLRTPSAWRARSRTRGW